MIVNTRNEFISYLQTKFSQEVAKMSEDRIFLYNSSQFYLIREMSEVIDFFANSRYNYVDENFTPTYSDTCNFDTDKIDRIIDFYKKRYKLHELPYIDYPYRTTNIVEDIFCGSGGGSSLPDGGGVDYYLTKDATGKLIWKKINSYLHKQLFIYQGGAQQFKLNIIPDEVYHVFVNGKHYIQGRDYTVNEETVTIISPNVLEQGDEVKIYSGFKTLILSDIGAGFNTIKNADGEDQFTAENLTSIIFEGINGIDITFDGLLNKVIISAGDILDGLLYQEEFVWSGDNNSFTLLNSAKDIFMVFINGQKLKSTDYSHDIDSNIVILTDVLETDDEIDISYKKTNI